MNNNSFKAIYFQFLVLIKFLTKACKNLGKFFNPETDCRVEPGTVVPVINRNKCEGKSDCLKIFPYDVFEIRLLTQSEKKTFKIR